MAQVIGVGIIGMGWMGEVHARAYRAVPDRFADGGLQPRLVVCADAVEARARAARERFGYARFTTDWREVMADPEVAVVDVTAPNGMHLELVRAAARAGKHVNCEKPVGRDPAETRAARAAAREAGILTFVGYNYRWAPVVQYARRLVAEGRLGRLTHYHGRFLNGYAGDPNGFLSWRFEREHGLGTLGDLMSHVIDMAHLMAGPIASVTSDQEIFIRRRPIPRPGSGTHYDRGTAEDPAGDVTNEDYVSALVRFEGGAHGLLEACRIVNGAKCDMSFELHGTKGAVKWTMERMNELQLQWRRDDDPAQDGYTTLLSGPAHPYHGHFNPAWGLGLGYDDLKVIEAWEFLRSVAAGKQGEPGFAEADAVARVQQAILRSWESRRWETVERE
ncbi:Gfo/Idh/MocA family protein [Anaeromyxobacter oryzae]|uniref:Oxidoreductase n=1 Tax=Anaeromyxobacter oryzae TaxID=2918170 RepID=A0ABN6N0L8_9BACT|nr:Gfo/Idh/MocA family oxidoreductase [Anaeromyxobacter oryzae]BDG05398.1 oxidoreductase [Anaeromyxobacter oryzae]